MTWVGHGLFTAVHGKFGAPSKRWSIVKGPMVKWRKQDEQKFSRKFHRIYIRKGPKSRLYYWEAMLDARCRILDTGFTREAWRQLSRRLQDKATLDKLSSIAIFSMCILFRRDRMLNGPATRFCSTTTKRS